MMTASSKKKSVCRSLHREYWYTVGKKRRFQKQGDLSAGDILTTDLQNSTTGYSAEGLKDFVTLLDTNR